MMKKLIYSICIFVLLGLAIKPVIVQAKAEPSNAKYSDELAQSIVQNCPTINNALTNLRRRDISTRVSRVYVYEFLLQRTKAFATRLKNNKLDHKALDADNQMIELQLRQLKQDYESYDDGLTELMSTNCKNDQLAFYNKLTIVRSQRKQLAADVENVHDSWQKVIKDIQQTKLKSTSGKASK